MARLPFDPALEGPGVPLTARDRGISR